MAYCNFCGASNVPLIKGNENLYEEVFICKKCAEKSIKCLKNSNKSKNIKLEDLKPSKIKGFLDTYLIGQDIAKKKIAVSIYNQYKKLNNKSNTDIEIDKSNIFVVGPTGTGKTFLVKTLAKMLNVPLAIEDATTLTEAGFVGNDVENCLRKLIESANGDVSRAEKGIIYIDEIDKIGRKGENPSLTKDVSGEGVQQALLKLVEGCIAEVPPKGGRKHPDQSCIKIDTSNILFIVGGAFEGIEKIIAKRIQGKRSVGFEANVINTQKVNINDYIHKVTVQDLHKFGMIPEFLGRFPIFATFDELDEKALVRILTEPKNALVRQYKELFKMDNVELNFTEEALTTIAELAIKRKTGARGLRGIIENALFPEMYSSPDRDIETLKITKEIVLDRNK